MKLRITYYGETDPIYSEVEEFDDADHDATLGTFEKPFLNTEAESFAYGLLESLAQSDRCPPVFFEEDVVKISITLISNNLITI